MSLTLEEMKSLPEEKQKAIYDRIQKIRKPYKTTNYGSLYGIGKAKLAVSLKSSVRGAGELLEAYWRRNHSVKTIASEQTVKVVEGQMWLLNPVSNLWMSLRKEKDIFSTLNQSTGVYCFDTWLGFVLKERPQLTAQFHDEGIWTLPEGRKDDMRALLERAIDKTNSLLKLNVPLSIDVKFGHRYSEIH